MTKKLIPASIRQKALVEQMSQIDLHLRRLCLKEGMEGDYMEETIKQSELVEMINAMEGDFVINIRLEEVEKNDE